MTSRSGSLNKREWLTKEWDGNWPVRDSEGKADECLIAPNGSGNVEVLGDLHKAVLREQVQCQKSARSELNERGRVCRLFFWQAWLWMRAEGQRAEGGFSSTKGETMHLDPRERSARAGPWTPGIRLRATHHPLSQEGGGKLVQMRLEGLEASAPVMAVLPSSWGRTLGHQMPSRGGHVGKLRRLKLAWKSRGEWEGELVEDCHLPVTTSWTHVLILFSTLQPWLFFDVAGELQRRKPWSKATLRSSWKSLKHWREGTHLPQSWRPSLNKSQGQKDPRQGPRSVWKCLHSAEKTLNGKVPMMLGLIQ